MTRMLKRAFKIIFSLGAVLCCVVVGIMYSKLSFIDWPYVIGAILFFGVAVGIQLKK